MTERAPGNGARGRPPLVLLLLPPAILLVAAAATPASAFLTDQGDINLYLEKARAVASGLLLYRDIPFEYPPLAIVPMIVPYLVSPLDPVALDIYPWLFAGWGAASLLALGLVLGRVVGIRATWGLGTLSAPEAADARTGGAGVDPTRRRAEQAWLGVRLAILTAGAALALAWRFDLFPALLSAVALWMALAGHARLAGMAIAAGVLAKLFPLVLVPALVAAWVLPLDVDRLRRFGIAAVLTLAGVLVPFLLAAGPPALGFLSYQALRGLQLESIGGGLVLLEGLARGQPVPIEAPFHSPEVTGPLASAWLGALPVLTGAAFALLGWLGWRRIRVEALAFGRVTPSTVVTLATASILVLLATSKVLSIQYIAWLVPFAALLPGARFWVAAAVVALTMPIHPLLYDELVGQQMLPVLVLNLRNFLLLGLTVWVLSDLRRRA